MVALDPPLDAEPRKWLRSRIKALQDLAQGFKVGLPAILTAGLKSLSAMMRSYEGLKIADLKLADIGDVMALSATILKGHHFDSIIAHSFVGRAQALEALSERCRELGLKLILVVSMTHEGSREYLDRHIDSFADLALELGAWGVVAPATRPEVLSRIKARVGDEIKILAPGVGAQGAKPGIALCHGADYEIVGRAITYAKRPRKAAERLLKEMKERVKECRGSA